MHLPQAIFLFLAGALGGAMNAVAGGGSFVVFPALLFTGVAPIPANASNNVALWFGIVASGGAYRRHLNLSRRILIPMLLASVVGGLGGAILLIHTPTHTFLRLIPWLLLGATLLFAFGRQFTGRLPGEISHDASRPALAGVSFLELIVAIYGGYFGGGIGIMNLALLSALGMTDIHAMNALKVVFVGVINGVAAVTFVVMGVVAWAQTLVVLLGALCGGFAAAHYAQRLPQSIVRDVVICIGAGMTVYFFVRAYL